MLLTSSAVGQPSAAKAMSELLAYEIRDGARVTDRVRL